MKIARKSVSLLAILALLFTLWAPVAVSAEAEPEFYFGRSMLAQMNNGEALCYAYDQLVSGCETISDNVSISHGVYTINSDEAFLVYQAVLNDRPDFFWLADGMSLRGTSKGITAFRPYVHDGIPAQREELAARVTELTADLAGKSDYEKSLILHDRVCNSTVYRGNIDDQTAVGSLLKGQAVCAGYARGYQLLLQAVGIPSYIVTGHSKNQNHAWNLVQLDGQWYYTDVTWDDQNDDGGYIYYAYLNTTYDRMAEDHTATEFVDYLPHAAATAANYHIVNDSAMASPNVNKIASLLKEKGYARIFVTGDMQTFMNDMGGKMMDVVCALTGSQQGYSYSLSYLGRELILNLEILHSHQYETVTTAATCTTDGMVTIRCTTCGDIQSTTILPATGHTEVIDPAVAATCTETGLTEGAHCGGCGITLRPQRPTDALGHHEIPDYGTEPTCTEAGLTNGAHCEICGVILVEQAPIPALGHDWSLTLWQSADGHGYFCYRCPEKDEFEAHVYDDDQDIDCNVCHYERPELPALTGDANGDGKVNNRDLGLLQKYINGYDVIVDAAASDMNGDGKLNNRDLGILQQLINAAKD